MSDSLTQLTSLQIAVTRQLFKLGVSERMPISIRHTVSKVAKMLLRFNHVRVTSYESLDFNKRQLEKYKYFRDLVDKLDDVEGHFVELGYGFGESFCIMAHLAAGKKKIPLWL